MTAMRWWLCGLALAGLAVGADDEAVVAAIKAHQVAQLRALLEQKPVPPSFDAIRTAAEELGSTGRKRESAQRMFEILLERSADPNACWPLGRQRERCLVEALVAVRSPDGVRALLRYGVKMDTAAMGNALIDAVEMKETEIVRLLIGAKVNVNCRRSGSGTTPQTPLSVALDLRYRELVDMLEAAGAREW